MADVRILGPGGRGDILNPNPAPDAPPVAPIASRASLAPTAPRWTPDTYFVEGQLLRAAAGSATYVALVTHVSGATFDATKWELLGTTPDSTAPGAVTGLAAAAAGADVSVSWTGPADATGYEISIDGAPPVAVTASPYVHAGGASANHSYAVTAHDAALNRSPAASVTFTADSTAPAAPTGLTAAAAGADVTVSWTAATDNVGVVGYNVVVDGGTPIRVTTTSYTHVGGAGGDHTYAVTAYDGAGNTSTAATVSYLAPTTVKMSSSSTDVGFAAGRGAMGFTPAANARITEIRYEQVTGAPAGKVARVGIASAVGATITWLGYVEADATVVAEKTLKLATPVDLVAGTKYFLVAESTDNLDPYVRAFSVGVTHNGYTYGSFYYGTDFATLDPAATTFEFALAGP